MNKVILMGRVVADPEIRYTQGENSTAVVRYRLAVNRKFKNSEGNYDADFINCVCFGKTAEFAEKFLHKGTKIAVSGRIQTGSYTNQEGQKVYTTDIVVEEHDFCESKGSSNSSNSRPQPVDGDGFMNIPDGIDDDELPFH